MIPQYASAPELTALLEGVKAQNERLRTMRGVMASHMTGSGSPYPGYVNFSVYDGLVTIGLRSHPESSAKAGADADYTMSLDAFRTLVYTLSLALELGHAK